MPNWKTLIKVIFVLCALFWVGYQTDFPQVWSHLQGAHILRFIIAVLMLQVVFVLQSLRWKHSILKIYQKKIPLSKVYQITLEGHLFNFILPSSIGGDIVKASSMSQLISSLKESYVSLISNRVQGVLSLFILYWMGYGLGHFLSLLQTIPYEIHLGVVLFQLLVFAGFGMAQIPYFQKLSPHIKILTQTKTYTQGFFLSFLTQLTLIITEYFVYYSVIGEVHFYQIFIIIPILYLILMIPLSIGGMGLREISAISLFTLWGISQEQIIAGVAMSYLLAVTGIIVALASYIYQYQSRKSHGTV